MYYNEHGHSYDWWWKWQGIINLLKINMPFLFMMYLFLIYPLHCTVRCLGTGLYLTVLWSVSVMGQGVQEVLHVCLKSKYLAQWKMGYLCHEPVCPHIKQNQCIRCTTCCIPAYEKCSYALVLFLCFYKSGQILYIELGHFIELQFELSFPFAGL